MSYITQTQLLAMFPASQIIACLDDDNDGVIDTAAWDEVSAKVDRKINAALEGRYALPLAEPYPAKLVDAAGGLAVAFAFMRRGVAEDACPFKVEIKEAREALKKIAEGGDVRLGVTPSASSAPSAITSPVQTGTNGDILA